MRRPAAPPSAEELRILGYVAQHPGAETAAIWRALAPGANRNGPRARLDRCERAGWLRSAPGNGRKVGARQWWLRLAGWPLVLTAALDEGES